MNPPAFLEHCLSFINCQLNPQDRPPTEHPAPPARRAITISRQSGCGGRVVAEGLATLLQTCTSPGEPPWKVFDRNLTDTVLAEHNLPERLARFMPEDRVRLIDDIMDDLFGLHPPAWTLAQQTAETILRLADAGNAIILGRGANVITARLPHVLHVRLVGSLERRIEHVRQMEGIGAKQAVDRIHQEDLGRQRYLKQNFGKDVEDPLLYHLVINTDLVPVPQSVQLILKLVLNGEQVTGLSRGKRDPGESR